MLSKRTFIAGGIVMASVGGLINSLRGKGNAAQAQDYPVKKTDAEWRKQLSPEAFHVLREHGTERAGTSPLNREKRAGTFSCAGCDQPLFKADTKFESGTGWPSFFDPMPGAIGTTDDTAFFMTRTEVHCSQCGGHLGHVFPDGPPPTGQRYCMNGVSLKFEADA